MPIEHAALLGFNAGAIGREAIARIDLSETRFAAEVQENLLPRTVGPAVFRPGTAYQFETRDNSDACCIPFVYDIDTTARIELTDFKMRAIVNDVVVTRPSVSTAITNGNFTANVTGWVDDDEAGATSDWDAERLRLLGTGTNRAVRRQEVAVGGGDIGVEHALRVIVIRGPIGFKVGSAEDGDDYIQDTRLREGFSSLAFTPTGNFHITIYSDARVHRYVDSVTVEAAGDMELQTPWSEDEIRLVRYDQSLDVIFCAKDATRQRRIERRSINPGEMRSWSVVQYNSDDGPFRVPNFEATTILASATTGNVTLTASRPIWKDGHIDALWKLTYNGQTINSIVAGDDQFSDELRISGVHVQDVRDSRTFDVTVTGTFVGTLTLQIAYGDPSGWTDSEVTFTAPGTTTIQDKSDNQIVYYRIGFKAGDYTSGSATVTLINQGGIQIGIVRITGFADSTHVNAEVLETLGTTDETSDWAEGEWSEYRGFPGAVAIDGGRLGWGWQDRVLLSVSDAYESYDEEMEGDAGPVVRTITKGSRDGVLWLKSAQRLLAGTAMEEPSIRSSSLDEPITPTKFQAKQASNRGSAAIQAVGVDSVVIFVQRGSVRAFALAMDNGAQDYASGNLCRLNDDILSPGVVGMAVQRSPDTRIWFTLADGTAAVLTFEPNDKVLCWTLVTTPGEIRDICVLPGTPEDIVYWVVKRTIDGASHYFHEKMARLDEVTGGTISKTVDCHVVYQSTATATITAAHLEGEDVALWADGEPYSTNRTIVGGTFTLNASVSNYVVGLPYEARFKSAKGAYGAVLGSPLSYPQKIDHIGMIMQDVTPFGVHVGRDFEHMTRFPKRPRGTPNATVVANYDYRGAPLDGGWDTDTRVCFKIASPYCGKFVAMAVSMQTGEAKVPANAQS